MDCFYLFGTILIEIVSLSRNVFQRLKFEVKRHHHRCENQKKKKSCFFFYIIILSDNPNRICLLFNRLIQIGVSSAFSIIIIIIINGGRCKGDEDSADWRNGPIRYSVSTSTAIRVWGGRKVRSMAVCHRKPKVNVRHPNPGRMTPSRFSWWNRVPSAIRRRLRPPSIPFPFPSSSSCWRRDWKHRRYRSKPTLFDHLRCCWRQRLDVFSRYYCVPALNCWCNCCCSLPSHFPI